MIWNDEMLIEWAKEGGVSPFDPKMINPASIDLRWSGRYRIHHGESWSYVHEARLLVMEPFRLYLLDTVEYVTMPADAAGDIKLKSSVGRMGIEHLHAGFVDPTFAGTLTLEMSNLLNCDITLTKNQPLVQLVLMSMCKVPKNPYSKVGRYMEQKVPTLSKGIC